MKEAVLDDFDRHEREAEKALLRLPRCGECEEPVQQENAVNLYGRLICDECLEKKRLSGIRVCTDCETKADDGYVIDGNFVCWECVWKMREPVWEEW